MFSDSPTVRKVIYGIAIAAQIASFFLVISFPDLAAALVAASGLLASVAGATALSNITPSPKVYGEHAADGKGIFE